MFVICYTLARQFSLGEIDMITAIVAAMCLAAYPATNPDDWTAYLFLTDMNGDGIDDRVTVDPFFDDPLEEPDTQDIGRVIIEEGVDVTTDPDGGDIYYLYGKQGGDAIGARWHAPVDRTQYTQLWLSTERNCAVHIYWLGTDEDQPYVIEYRCWE